MASLVLVRFVEGIDCVIVGIDVLSLSVVGSSKAKFPGVELANIDL